MSLPDLTVVFHFLLRSDHHIRTADYFSNNVFDLYL